MNDIMKLVGNNWSKNKYVVSLLDVSFFGCVSHLFNHALQDFISSQINAINLVDLVMKEFTRTVFRTSFHLHINLPRVKSGIIWWSTVYVLVQRYQKIRLYLSTLHITEIDEALQSNHENRKKWRALRRFSTTWYSTKQKYEKGFNTDASACIVTSKIEAFSNKFYRLR